MLCKNANLNFFEESGWLPNTAAMVHVEVTVHMCMQSTWRTFFYTIPEAVCQEVWCSSQQVLKNAKVGLTLLTHANERDSKLPALKRIHIYVVPIILSWSHTSDCIAAAGRLSFIVVSWVCCLTVTEGFLVWYKGAYRLLAALFNITFLPLTNFCL